MAADEKDRVRRSLRARRAALPPESRDQAAWRLAEGLLRHPLVAGRDPGPVLVPVAHRSEIDTGPLARRLADAGWTLVRPRSDAARAHIDAVPWPIDQGLVAGLAGIPEPPPDAPVLDPHALVLILVPGVAFARDGHRVGSGAGFFDRFLEPLKRSDDPPVAIGIGYRTQEVPAVPWEPHDVALDGLQLEDLSIVTAR